MKGKCALYDIETDLRESHIYPKFVIKHTKKTGSDFLRRVVDPNKREQDGLKLYLLSSDAEQKFGVREKWFAENIFVPYLKGKLTFDYDQNLYYFAISFLWRILLTEFKTNKELKNKWYYEQLKEVEIEWRKFLDKEIIPTKYHNANLVFTDRIKSHTTDLKGVDFYFTRMMDATIVSSPDKTLLFLYGKFNRFIFWSVIKSPKYNDELYEVEINPKKGTIEVPQGLDYEPILTFIGNRIKGISEFPSASTEQQEKIEKEIMKNPEKFLKSDVWKSLFNDQILEE